MNVKFSQNASLFRSFISGANQELVLLVRWRYIWIFCFAAQGPPSTKNDRMNDDKEQQLCKAYWKLSKRIINTVWWITLCKNPINTTESITHYLKENVILKMWIMWKMRFWKCEFCEKWDLKIWIMWKMRFWKCDFCEKWDFGNVYLAYQKGNCG